MFLLKDLIYHINGSLIWGTENSYLNSFSIDTRVLKEKDVFIALKGKTYNGHDFILESLNKKAKGIICSESAFLKNSKLKNKINFFDDLKFIVKVEDTLETLGLIASYYRKHFKGKLIAVTGSTGKTTTKDFLSSILSLRYKVSKTTGTQNNQIGVPLSILKSDQDSDIIILELGSNHKGEINYLSEICKPDIGVITNVGPSHLEYFKSVENVKAEKLSLFKNLNIGGLAVYNSDFFNKHQIPVSRRISFGIKEKADFQAKEIKKTKSGLKFKVRKEDFFINTQITQYIYNVLACMAVLSCFDIDAVSVKKALSSFQNNGRRFEKIRIGRFMLIDDTYNSNPVSAECAVKSFAGMNYKRKLVIFADMLELGMLSEMYHEKIGRIIADSGIDFLFTIGKFSDSVIKSAVLKGMNPSKIKKFKTLEEITDCLKNKSDSIDAVLIKGSRGMNMDKVADNFKNYLLNKK